MMTKIEWLRAQMEAYLTDAEAQADEREAMRLFLLAVRCQEQILDLEYERPPGSMLQ